MDRQGRAAGNHRQPRTAIIGGLIVAAVFAAYVQVLGFDFVDFDDGQYVTENFRVQAGLSMDGIRWAWTSFDAANWHPLTWLSHMTDVALFGLEPGWHHMSSVILHAVNSLLLYLVMIRFTGDIRKSAFVAAVFALHPLHVESVAWISERKDVLSGTFWILTMAAYGRYAAQPSVRRMLLVCACFIPGLMSKPMLVTLPVVLLLMDIWPLARNGGREGASPLRLVTEKWPLFLLSMWCGLVTLMAQKGGGAVATLSQVTPVERISNAFAAYASYLWKTVFPVHLSAFYPHPREPGIWLPLSGCLLVYGLTVLAFAHRKSRPAVFVGWLWFCITLLPVIGLIQVGHQSMADRYMYLPMIGLLIAIAWFPYQEWMPVRRFPAAGKWVGIGMISILYVLSVPQIATWRNTRTMAEQALAVTEDNYLMHTIMGNVHAREGRHDAAMSSYRTAIRIKSDFHKAYFQAGKLMLADRGAGEALTWFTTAATLAPGYTEAHVQRGNALAAEGRYPEAVAAYQTALAQRDDLPHAHTGLAMVLDKSGDMDAAMAHYRKAVELNPAFAEAHGNLGQLLAARGDFQAALPHVAAAATADPELPGIHYNLANLLVQLQRLEDAYRAYLEHLNRFPAHADAYNNLGILWLHAGQPGKAISCFGAAHHLRPDVPAYKHNLEAARRRAGAAG